MSRQKQQGTRNGNGSRRNESLEDALAATHQNSVPVLPAYGTPPQAGDPGAYSPSKSLARGTLAPNGTSRQRTLADTTTFANTTRERTRVQPARPSGDLNRDRGHTGYGSGGNGDGRYETRGNTWGDAGRLPAGVADEVYDADTTEQSASSRGARTLGASMSRALVPGPSTLPADLLPAVAEDAASRQLALAGDAAPETPALLIRGTSRTLKPYTPIVPKRHGPRSFMSQFIISMVAVMTIFTVLSLASPLGRSQAFAGSFKSYANAVPWIPTPTPTPKPKPAQVYAPPAGANPGQQAVINDIVAVFGANAQGAINVARCESGFDPNAWNPYAIGGSHASGVFQILYPSTWGTTSWSGQSPYNYDANIHAAYQIFSRDGYSWREWSCGIYA